MKRIIALFLIFGGLLAILSNLNILNIQHLFSYLWPSLLILLGLAGLVNSKSSFIFPSILILIGGLYLAKAFDVLTQFHLLAILWPAIIILIGVGLLFPRHNRGEVNRSHTVHIRTERPKSTRWNVSNQRTYNALLCGIDEKIDNKAFSRVSVTALLGSADIDLREIELKDNDATIEINAIMGAVDLYLPTGYKLEVEGTPILGAFDNACESDPNATKTLHISYATVMGAIEIRH